MSKCETCARIIACPRPETREVRLKLVEKEIENMDAYMASRLDTGEPIPSSLYVEYVICGSVSPYNVASRISAVLFRTVMDVKAYFPFLKMLKESTKKFPDAFKMLVHSTLSGALQLYEWKFYDPHIKHFTNIAVGSGLKELATGIDRLNAALEKEYPCVYMNLQESVSALQASAPKSKEEANAIIEKFIEKSKQDASKASKGLPIDVFKAMQPVGGIN